MDINLYLNSADEDANEMYALAEKLYPICRSITGDGVRESLRIIQEEIPQLNIKEIATGTRCFDWTIPQEWNINDAYIIDPDGHKIVSFKESNLHVVGYSEPVSMTLSLEQLQNHLYSLEDMPDTIPYVTSYYNRTWGFCLTQNLRDSLKSGMYEVVIDSELKDGSLTYAEIIIPGKVEKEIFLSTYICHPSMGNNELSGPVVTTRLTKFLMSLDNKYTYRIIFIPETIGSIMYLSLNIDQMKKNTIAGFNITCVGDDNCYSFLPSRNGNTVADRAACHVLNYFTNNYDEYTFMDRGSDERQYCSPGVDLPVACIMRSKYATYKEYHTSDDNLDFISPQGLQGAFDVIKKSLLAIEINCVIENNILCEPQLGKRDLYAKLSFYQNSESYTSSALSKNIINIMAYSDGKLDLLQIADQLGISVFDVYETCKVLLDHNLIKILLDDVALVPHINSTKEAYYE